MSDLISRSAMHNKICKHFNIPKDWDGDIAEPLQTVLDLIENQNCAYDVDAVVEELETYQNQHNAMCEQHKVKTIEDIYNKAIDDFADKLREICSNHSVGADSKNNNEPLYAHRDGTWHSLSDDVVEQLKKGDADYE